MKVRLPFILSLWTAIIVALLSALAPLGPPSSRLTGSAFNPATTSVAIKARRPDAAALGQVIDPARRDNFAAGLGIVWLVPLALLLRHRCRLALATGFLLLSSAPSVSPFNSRRQARAPPVLS